MVNQHYHLSAELDGFVSLRDNQNQIVFMIHSDEVEKFLTDSDECDQALLIIHQLWHLSQEESYLWPETD